MKKSLLIATAAIVFCPLTAFAQNAQTSIQNSSNSAAAVGTGNYNAIQQNTVQDSSQTNVDVGSYLPNFPY